MNRPPFSPVVAMSARQSLGLSPQQVTEQMNACGVPVDISMIHAWEVGEYRPTEDELFVLADVLWCRTTDLMEIEAPRTLAEHRLARRFSTAKLAHAIGMDTAEYERAELRNTWTGDGRQTVALLRTLHLTLPELARATEGPGTPGTDLPTPLAGGPLV
ncbi:helix-turn-helix domain-containing protein [Streptomyces humi]|uniref:helix-turn-helix domain-containing protein n=1 Tax=Streptomyces humi TaxID=1428620 RepID=UPI0007C70441|nr:helix-turn-helix transcriptional regulator [Streptomyces humi]